MAQLDRPVHEIRLGKVKAAIWRNESDNGPRFNVTFARIYKTESGWQSTDSFGRDELPLVTKVSDMAHTWIYQQSDRSEAPNETKANGRASSGKRERAGSR